MEAKEKEILNELISGTKCQFVIPVFQRNYDWRIKDCDRLFEDIVELAADKLHPDRKHFIGAFVCKFNKFVDTSFNQYILIDGQQRLTSITLILKAVYDYLGQFGDKYEELRNEIKETYLINKFAKDFNLRLKLKPNQLDNDNFNKLMNDEEIDVESTIGRNYSFFFEKLNKLKISIEDFYNALQRLEGVVVFLDDTDNPQVIFESLNSTGLELTDVDLIRNYLLMNCKATLQETLYKNYWLKIENVLGNQFLAFIRDYLSFENGIVTSSSKNYIYQSFQKFYRSEDRVLETYLAELLRLAEIYSKLVKLPDGNSELDKALKDYINLDIKTTYPFVFGLMIDNADSENGKKISDKELAKTLRLLESYLIRRNICNLAGGGVSQVMASLYKDLKKKYGDRLYKDTSNKVAIALASITTKAYFPKNEQFIRELTERDMFHNRNIHYILSKLESFVQSKELIDSDSLTIDHVMPQTLSAEWINYLNVPDWKEFHDNYVHLIGNLTLTAYNSEMSNKLYEEKKSHIDFSRLILNLYFKNINYWGKQEIKDRGIILADLATKVWPYPIVNSIEDIANESHFLFDDNEDYEYTGTNPVGIQIREEKIFADNWAILFSSTLKYLFQANKDLFLAKLLKDGFAGSEKLIISKDANDFRAPFPIGSDFYCETNQNTERKLKILKTIFKEFQYEQDEILIYIK